MRRALVVIVASVVMSLVSLPCSANGADNGLTKAQAALLRASDFSGGWMQQGSASASKGEGNIAPYTAVIDSCIGRTSPTKDLVQSAALSPTFTFKVTRQVNGSATLVGGYYVREIIDVWPTDKDASSEFKAISSPAIPSCAAALLAGSAKQQLEGNGTTVGKITVTPTNGRMLVAHSSGLTFSFSQSNGGGTIDVHQTVISMVRGRTEKLLYLLSIGASFVKPPVTFPDQVARHLGGITEIRS